VRDSKNLEFYQRLASLNISKEENLFKDSFLRVLIGIDSLFVLISSVIFFIFSRDIVSFGLFLFVLILLGVAYFSLVKGADIGYSISFYLLMRLFVIALLLGQDFLLPIFPTLFILSFPMVAFFLKGRTGGVKWMVGLFGIFALILCFRLFGVKIGSYTLMELRNILFILVLISVFLWFFELKKEETSLILQSHLYYDGLTGLPNRNSLIRDIDSMVAPGLVLINLDGFREINDIFGYRVGDFVLVEFGKKIQEFLPEEVKGPYRLSSDEFAVLQELYGKREPGEELKDLVLRASDWPSREWLEPEGYRIQVQVTAGVASSLAVGVEHLVSRADIALKTAKKQRQSFLFYKEASLTKKYYENNIKWAKILTDALKDNRVMAYYQPILNNHTGKIDKFESLVRLIDESGKVVPPFYFLEIAKKSRQYSKLTRIMFQSALETLSKVDAEFSVNLSVEDILDPSTQEFFNVAMEIYPNLTHKIVFEILESDGIENYDEVSLFIKRMKGFGCQFAVDDFGTGYSNFAHILKLDVDYLKIDGSLIKTLDEDKDSAIVVENIVDFSSKLGLKTIAEFVHSEAVFKRVKECGIDYSQGYWISEPLPEPKFD